MRAAGTQQQVNQAPDWNGQAGRAWVEAQGIVDDLFRPIELDLADAVRSLAPGRVLDVGCGTGNTTLAASRALPDGRCIGVDISEPMIAAARERSALEGMGAEFIRADAESHRFEPAAFEMIVSRFGVMFFRDPIAAFANLRRAASPGAALRFFAWRSMAENPFMTTAEQAAAPLLPELPERRPDEPGQFAFADPDRVGRILRESGWKGVEIRPFDFECRMSIEHLELYMTRLGPVGLILSSVEESTRGQVVEAMRRAFDDFRDGAFVQFNAACWLVTAQA